MKKYFKTIMATMCVAAAGAGSTAGFYYAQSINKTHILDDSITAVTNPFIPESKYIVFPYLGTDNCIRFMGQLKELNKKTGIGWYYIDLSNAVDDFEEYYTKYNLEHEISYTVYKTDVEVDPDTSASETSKTALYSSYGYKSASELSSEVGYVTDFGVPQAISTAKAMSELSVMYTSVSALDSTDKTKTVVTIGLTLSGVSSSLEFDTSRFFIEDMGKIGNPAKKPYVKTYMAESNKSTVVVPDSTETDDDETTVDVKIRFYLDKDNKPDSIRLCLADKGKTQEEYEKELAEAATKERRLDADSSDSQSSSDTSSNDSSSSSSDDSQTSSGDGTTDTTDTTTDETDENNYIQIRIE